MVRKQLLFNLSWVYTPLGTPVNIMIDHFIYEFGEIHVMFFFLSLTPE